MLKFFRGIATSWFGPVIMGALVLAFGILGGGMRDVLRGRIENAVVAAGSHQISASEFQRLFDAKKTEYEQQTSQPFPIEEALREGVDRQIVRQLAEQTAFAEMLTRSGVRPSDEVVAIELRQQAEAGGGTAISELFDPVTGKFRPDQLQRFLASNHITMQEFQSSLADDVASQDFAGAVTNSFQLPRIYAAIQASLLTESRDFTYFVIPAASVPKPPPPTDAQLSALIQQNRERLMLPERRVLTVVRFSAKKLAPSMTVDLAAVQQQFEAKKASYGKPELRTIVEIPLNDPKDAAAVQAALARGEDPNVAAKAVGSTAIVYQDQAQSAIANAKAAAAAFAMKEGEVSGPVQGDFKTVILKVAKVTPAQAPDLDTARAQIVADLQHAQALDKVLDLSQKYEDLRQGGASVADAAAKVGVSAVTIGPVTADGKGLPNAPPNPLLSQKMLHVAFGLAQGADSDVEQDSDKGEYFVVQVQKVIPPNPPGLEEPGVRPILIQAYLRQAIVGALQKKANAAIAAIQKGQSFEAVAAANGAQLTHQIGLQRVTAQQYAQTLGQDFLVKTFEAKAGQLFFAGSDPLNGFVVARVDAIHPADPSKAAVILEAVRQHATQDYLRALVGAVRDASVQLVKPATDIDIARNAMGADPAMIARATAKSAPKGASLAR